MVLSKYILMPILLLAHETDNFYNRVLILFLSKTYEYFSYHYVSKPCCSAVYHCRLTGFDRVAAWLISEVIHTVVNTQLSNDF